MFDFDATFGCTTINRLVFYGEEVLLKNLERKSICQSVAYIHIHHWSIQPFNQDYDLGCHSTYVNYMRQCRKIYLKSSSNDK